MSKEKGFFSEASEKAGREIGDAKVEGNFMVEMVDGPLIGGAIDVLDDILLDKVVKDEVIKAEFRAMFDQLIIEENAEAATILAVEIQQRAANVPGLNDDIERELVKNIIGTGLNFALLWLQKQKS